MNEIAEAKKEEPAEIINAEIPYIKDAIRAYTLCQSEQALLTLFPILPQKTRIVKYAQELTVCLHISNKYLVFYIYYCIL